MSDLQLFIEHLRVHEAGGNAVALKLGLQQALRRVRLRAGGVPPHATLVIRRLQSRTAFGLKAAQMTNWQQQLQAQIDDLARRALRPWRQYIPANADSVLFDDDVELLVCYTRDLLAQRSAWYWANLFPTVYPGQSTLLFGKVPSRTQDRGSSRTQDQAQGGLGQRLLAGWETYPQAIPHTLVELKPHEARNALNSLSHSQLSRLAQRLHETFTLPGDVFDAVAAESSSVADQPVAPWHQWLPPLLYQHLTPQAEYILGLSHTLVHRPQQARQRRFAQEARQWLEKTAFRPSQERGLPRPATANRPAPAEFRQTAVLPPPEPQPEAAIQVSPIKFAAAEGIFTRLGGAIFLINLLTRLKLPAAIPALEELNPWELLGGLTVDLLGGRFTLYQADPLWQIIEELAGLAPEERWGQVLPDPVSFYLPPEWLAHLSITAIAGGRERRDGRLRLWDTAAAILIADLPDEREALDNLVATYQESGIAVTIEPQSGWTELPTRPNQRLADNFGWTIARLRPFITHFLHHLAPSKTQDRLDPTLPIESILYQPATLYRSRTHVDLCLSLEQISIPLRRAGLDRTPGWLPDFGTILTIYFE